jgi:hypothetical protein
MYRFAINEGEVDAKIPNKEYAMATCRVVTHVDVHCSYSRIPIRRKATGVCELNSPTPSRAPIHEQSVTVMGT